MHMHMVKVISLSESAYEELKDMKQTDESFSDVVQRLAQLVGRKRDIQEFFGVWSEAGGKQQWQS